MCPVCRQSPSRIGVLCEECREELAGHVDITPEQVEVHVTQPTVAALIDRWGRLHRLEVQTAIGRNLEGQGLAILESSVSRHHAVIWLDDGIWWVRDLGSANGTMVEGRPVEQPVQLHDADQVRFGHIEFFVVLDISGLSPPPRPNRTISKTLRPEDSFSTVRSMEPLRPAALRVMTFEFHEPTGGGGGVVDIDGKQVQLTIPQFELMTVLVQRMLAEIDQPAPLRGFVASSELMTTVSWDAPEPADDHVRQLVRRVRRLLVKAGIEDAIESRHGLGYRLHGIPRLKAPLR